MTAKPIRGPLAGHPKLIQRAMEGAARRAELEPVRRFIDDEHWIFEFARPEPRPEDEADP